MADTMRLLSPPQRSNRYRAWPIGTAPFFAMLICAANAGTVGGILVDGDAGDLRPATR